jgi:ppGpp synthetase/RelA/SpoT-type nucleotidyltranferase
MDSAHDQGSHIWTRLMDEAEFRERWHRERAMYRAWGALIQAEIEKGLTAGEAFPPLEVFLKIPTTPRLKTEDSLIGKAFYRNKPYRYPYAQIEDKVGMRFVVLLTTDIRRIQDIIEASTSWVCSLDRDFEAEKDERPTEFAYQSKHYVLKAAQQCEFSGITIDQGTPCEVQLRTLLQHAHSELTHDNIYKRDTKSDVTKKVQRTVAKSMALIEAVDDYFLQAVAELEAATDLERSSLASLVEIYVKNVGHPPHNDKSSALIFSAYQEALKTRPVKDFILEFLGKHAYVNEKIRERATRLYMFRQPWIYFIYALVDTSPIPTARNWPLTPEELRQVYVDLGKRFPL